MKIKDKIINWYLRNIYFPKFEIIDNPAFICERVGQRKDIYLREILLNENFIINLENSLKKEDKTLYSIGKKFGYSYSNLSKFINISSATKNNILQSAYFLVRYIEAISSYGKLTHKINYSKRLFKLKMKDYIVCSKNGLGYIFSEGGIAGIWSYVMQDLNIEAVQPKCQGRGDKECLVIAAPYETLVKMGYNPIRCEEIEKNHKENNING